MAFVRRCFAGNQADTATIIPIITAFQARHRVADMVVAADAGMLCAGNLRKLDEAGLRFIVGSRVTKAPIDLASHFHWHGDAFTDGQVIDTITPKTGHHNENNKAVRAEPAWNPHTHPGSWRAVWAYSHKRAVRDRRTLAAQEQRARAVVNGQKTARSAVSMVCLVAGFLGDTTRAMRWLSDQPALTGPTLDRDILKRYSR